MLTAGQTVWVPVFVEDLHDRGNAVILCCGRRVTVHTETLEWHLKRDLAIQHQLAESLGPEPEMPPGA